MGESPSVSSGTCPYCLRLLVSNDEGGQLIFEQIITSNSNDVRALIGYLVISVQMRAVISHVQWPLRRESCAASGHCWTCDLGDTGGMTEKSCVSEILGHGAAM
jgi:hypothetical protein